MSEDGFKYALFIVWGIVITAMLLCLGGCGATEARADGTYALTSECASEGKQLYIVTDNDTGAQYVVVNAYRGVAMCPRLNTDGTPHTEGE